MAKTFGQLPSAILRRVAPEVATRVSATDLYVFDVTATWRYWDMRRDAQENANDQRQGHQPQARHRKRPPPPPPHTPPGVASDLDALDASYEYEQAEQEYDQDPIQEDERLITDTPVLREGAKGSLYVRGTEIPPWEQ